MRAVIVVAAALSLSACAHMSDVMEAHDAGKGVAKVYAVGEQQAWTAAVAVMHWAGADTVEQHPDKHYMLAQSGVGAFSYGTLLGAWVEQVDARHTRVTVVSKRKVATEAITDMSEDGFHTDLAKAIALLEAGQPLPAKEPESP